GRGGGWAPRAVPPPAAPPAPAPAAASATAPAAVTRMLFTLNGRDATFRNEVFVICLDADGTVGGARPGQKNFLRRSSLAGRIKVLFRPSEEAGAKKVLDLPARDRPLFGIPHNSPLNRPMPRH